ncbi:unnamed protein product [Phytophthora fragariaefolia]|uniref:Unnamed protein product n=1 Tax=Phytophthora fragariaefolia TaxID=1490495 RepID=A0A9W6Y3Z4_9STRA|nr:unnamed protein product [Phytophthora fragariaefolia]
MLRPPSTPIFSTDSLMEHSLRPEDEYDFSGELHAFVTSHRDSSEGNQALSPPPPPPPPPSHHPSSSARRPVSARLVQPRSPLVENLQTSSKKVSTINSKQASQEVQSLKSCTDMQRGNQSTNMPVPSVHPIDTLSKKLRQQAMELTQVYEELEKQNSQIDDYKQQIRDQKRQLEQLRVQHRKSIEGSSKLPTNARATVFEQQRRAAQMMIGTPSTGASVGQKRGELERKIKEAEGAKKKYELAAKRIEKALVELQVFQNDRMEKLLASNGDASPKEDDASGDLDVILNEQLAYIRVLEEAVHLKATDFEITGHEELLVVLAELRHTIYEQEKDVEQTNSALSSIQDNLEQEKQHHLETKNLLDAAQKQQDAMAHRYQEQESALYAQIDEIQGKLKQRNDYLNQLEDASTTAQRAEEALQNRLTAATKNQNLTDAKLENATRNTNALREQFDSVTMQFEEAKRQIVTLKEECAKKQAHLDELNALQDELLSSVDKYVGKLKKSRDKVERLEAELQLYKDKLALTSTQADDASRSSREQLTVLHSKISEAEHREQKMQAEFSALQRENKRLESTLTEVQQSLQSQIQESSEQETEIIAKEKECNQIEEAIAELEAALATTLRMMQEKSAEPITPFHSADSDKSNTDLTEQSYQLDQAVLRDFHGFCQALDAFKSNDPSQSTSLWPSLPQIITRTVEIGERVQAEVGQALASWSRERSNLLEACSVLESTAQICHDEMEKRHEDICGYRMQLAERTLEFDECVMQVKNLEEELFRAKAECEVFDALEQQVTSQARSLEAKDTLIHDLSAENNRLIAVENAYSVQIATNSQLTQKLEGQREAMAEQRSYAEELEHALEGAATFAEQQNACNQQVRHSLFHAVFLPYSN